MIFNRHFLGSANLLQAIRLWKLKARNFMATPALKVVERRHNDDLQSLFLGNYDELETSCLPRFENFFSPVTLSQTGTQWVPCKRAIREELERCNQTEDTEDLMVRAVNEVFVGIRDQVLD